MEICQRVYQCYQILFKYFFVIFFFMVGIIFPSGVFGESNWKISEHITILPEEMVLLPKWCQIRMMAHPVMFDHKDADPVPDSIMVQNARIAKVFGEGYVYAHHYCRGLNWLNRYRRSKSLDYYGVQIDRQRALNTALGDFRFIKNHMKPSHKLYTDLLMNEAELCWEKKDYKVATSNYLEILKRKPDYAPAYVKYAEILTSIGEKDEAIKILNAGLEMTNNSPTIKRALDELN